MWGVKDRHTGVVEVLQGVKSVKTGKVLKILKKVLKFHNRCSNFVSISM